MPMDMPSATKQPKKLTMWILIAAGIIMLGVGGWFGYKQFFGSIKLETYNASDYSISIPSGWEKKDSNGASEFIKKGASEDDSSSVVTFYQAYPQSLTSSELQTVKDELHKQLENSSSQFVSGSDTLENIKLANTTYHGQDALKLTGDVKRSGKSSGKITLVAVATKTDFYIVGVAARNQDGSFSKKTDQIIDSFAVKK